MGNKDKGKREAKKPKKVTPKLPPPRRDTGSQVPAHIAPKTTE